MQKLTIVAHITSQKDKVEFVKQELFKLIQPTRAEKGCIQYDLHQDNDRPEHFMFYENWESRPLWQDHMNSKHLQDYKQKTQGMVEVIIHEMTYLK